MLISLCIACHNRAYNLKEVFPSIREAANFSPPVEIVILDYNSPDDLQKYIQKETKIPLLRGGKITYKKYVGRDYYHMAHARNLAILASSGEYCVMSDCDTIYNPAVFAVIRGMVSKCVWIWDNKLRGIMCFKREDFISLGGYDERFEFYGPEDRDLQDRLTMKYGFPAMFPYGLIYSIPTPNKEKVKNYRLKIGKQEMHRLGAEIYKENKKSGILTVNPNGWGRWE